MPQISLLTLLSVSLATAICVGLNFSAVPLERVERNGQHLIAYVRFPQWPFGRIYWFTHVDIGQTPEETVEVISGIDGSKQRPDLWLNAVTCAALIAAAGYCTEKLVRRRRARTG